MNERPPKILAIASGGGHWIQLMRLTRAFDGGRLYLSSTYDRVTGVPEHEGYFSVPDANANEKGRMILLGLKVLFVTLRLRPDVVVTTGAAPGFYAVLFGKLLGAKTIWIDSIANAEQFSLAGLKARRWADHWCSQWPEVAEAAGAEYIGSVI